jgi:hypothetical protein
VDQAWIIVADRENMERVAKHGVFGLNSKGPMGRVQPGDGVVAYVKGEMAFAGIGKVTEAYYMDDTPLFNGGLFPDRFGIELNLLPPEAGKDIYYFLDDLEFPSDKSRWSASLVSGIRRISPHDFELFRRQLARA